MKIQIYGLMAFVLSVGASTAHAREVYLNCDDDRGNEVTFAVLRPTSPILPGYIEYITNRGNTVDSGSLSPMNEEKWQAPGQVAYSVYSGRPGSMFYDAFRTIVQLPQALLTGQASHGEGLLIQRTYREYRRTDRALNCDVVKKPTTYPPQFSR